MTRIRLYIDEDAMDQALVIALRARQVDVVTAKEANLVNSSDEEHLRRAAANRRVLYSFNIADYVRLHRHWTERGKAHSGIVLSPQQRFSVGEQCRRLLWLLSNVSADEMCGRLEFLTAWSSEQRIEPKR